MSDANIIRLGMYQAGTQTAVALLVGDAQPRVFDLRKAAAAMEAMAPRGPHPDFDRMSRITDLVSIFDQFPDLDLLRDLAERIDDMPEGVELGDVVLTCPIRPRQVYCVGMNIAQLFVKFERGIIQFVS